MQPFCVHTSLRPEDEAFLQRELEAFIPDKVFDAHAHFVHPQSLCATTNGEQMSTDGPTNRRLASLFYGRRRYGAMMISYVPPGKDVPGRNQFVADQVARDADLRGAMFVTPQDDPEYVREQVRRLKLHGLKVYHDRAVRQPTWNAEIPEYLTEEHVRIAHEEGLTITLHMVKPRAVADPGNIHWIRLYCEKYPNMKLILAHSARGFQPSHNLEGLPHLKGLDNLYFDTSANCEPMAHQAIIRIIGHERLMYGADFPVSHMRGRSVGVADSFLWLYEHSPVWGEKHTQIHPVMIGLEHLRSVKHACWSERLTDKQVEDIFWNNAAKLFNLAS